MKASHVIFPILFSLLTSPLAFSDETFTPSPQSFDFTINHSDFGNKKASKPGKFQDDPYYWGFTVNKAGQGHIFFRYRHPLGEGELVDIFSPKPVKGLRAYVNPSFEGTTLEGIYLIAETQNEVVICAKKRGLLKSLLSDTWENTGRCTLQVLSRGVRRDSYEGRSPNPLSGFELKTKERDESDLTLVFTIK